MEQIKSLEELEFLRQGLIAAQDKDRIIVTVCGGSGCLASGSAKVAERLGNAMAAEELDAKVEMKKTGCHGFCERGPIVVIEPAGILYQAVGRKRLERDVDEIVVSLGNGLVPVDRLLYKDPDTKKPVSHYNDIPFYAKQQRVALRNNGRIDPTSIEDYLITGGYGSVLKALQMDPEDVIKVIEESGLRGRGGAGFPTGLKWRFCRNAPGDVRYVICNGDEGDPGAFMDRSIMEGDPHAIIEGMLIGARAMGAQEGALYVRGEYPLAVKHLSTAITQATSLGLLGKNVMGSDFSFDLRIVCNAGAFISGEETALIHSVEGSVAEPRPRPPFPAQSGLYGQPTCINNVETWANVPVIIEKGPAWYRNIGVEKNSGTKVFSLVGKVKNTGLVEVPMGTSIRDVVFEIGNGILKNKPFKAVQTGGPAGGCIPESLLDLPLTFEGLTEAGAIMGSGGMIVLDSETCMVDVAKYFLEFNTAESCGKCTPCHEGTTRMLEILHRICAGEGREEDLVILERLGNGISATSLCGLGQLAANPVLTTLRFFRDEYLAHIQEKKCPAGVCKALITYRIDPDACNGCRVCLKNCPVEAITGEKKQIHTLDQDKCTKCGACREGCKFDAVIVE
jgi:NADH-quinone oxidoreductase subunit F